MLARLEIQLGSTEKITYQMSSLFHGALMELLPADYADFLHCSQLHPYAQHLELRNAVWYWVVSCLNEKASQIIIHDTLKRADYINLKKQNIRVQFVQKQYQELEDETFADTFYRKDCSRYLQVHFQSPISFKQRGRYLIYPDIRCIYQSLMNKYDAVNEQESMVDEETLEQLCENTEIIRYDLKSVHFSLEGVRIPSFIGKVTFKFYGSQTMVNFANLLFAFGTYSGVGIKTTLGMGAIRLLDGNERGRNSDRQAD